MLKVSRVMNDLLWTDVLTSICKKLNLFFSLKLRKYLSTLKASREKYIDFSDIFISVIFDISFFLFTIDSVSLRYKADQEFQQLF